MQIRKKNIQESYGLSAKDLKTLKSLTTPQKIQDFLNNIPANYEKKGETCMSPARALRENKIHCIEGAMIAALALSLAGERPLLMDLRASKLDYDHVVALYRRNGYWGAISKSNHATLRFRDPVYRTLRELALSYFHEYFDNKTKKKTLRSFSKPLNLNRFGKKWITSEDELWHIAEMLDDIPHLQLVTKKNERLLRPADSMEMKAGTLLEWKKTGEKN